MKATEYILNAFYRCYGPAILIGTALVQILLAYVAPETTMEIKYLTLPFAVILLVVLILIDAFRACLFDGKTFSSKVLVSLAPLRNDYIATLLAESSKLFSHEMFVCIYYNTGQGVEQYIGQGFIAAVQNDGKLQVVVAHDDATIAMEGLWTRIRANDATIIKDLFIKPGVRSNYY